jgi:predicted enzyme related to lactoylglutathione lyase
VVEDQQVGGLAATVGYCVTYVADLPAMTAFYQTVLGLPVVERNDRFVAFGGAGWPLALEAGGPPPAGPRPKLAHPTLWQFIVPDLDAAVATLAAAGVVLDGEVKHGRFGSLAFFHDPEGNRLALLQR